MHTIEAHNLKKMYRTPLKGSTLLHSFFARKYKENTALKDISFSIPKGELVGFIGPNGAGKTTTMKILAGILYPTQGTVRVLGYTPFEKKHEYLRQIGFVMGQKNQLIWDLPAMETFLLNKEVYSIPQSTYRTRLTELVELLEAQDFLDQPVKTLSLGQRMRAELIASLLHQPKILFLDEPTIGLDIFAQTTIISFIQEYQKRHNSTIMLTSHYMQDVQRLANRIIMIDQGQIKFDGSMQHLIDTYTEEKTITITIPHKLGTKEREILKNIRYTYQFPQLHVHVPKKQVPTILTSILSKLEYTDLTIENETLEDIIKKKFRST